MKKQGLVLNIGSVAFCNNEGVLVKSDKKNGDFRIQLLTIQMNRSDLIKYFADSIVEYKMNHTLHCGYIFIVRVECTNIDINDLINRWGPFDYRYGRRR